MSDVQADVRNAMSKPEFIALIAMLFATIAFSLDAMLPALPEIGQELSPDDLNRAQLILTSFVLGMGIGTFFTGPLSDAFGRRRVMFAGAAIYIIACAVAWASSSLELVLAARVVQGIAVAAPRVVGLAVIRDLFSGREMAKIMSLAMMIFTIFPAFAPLIGSGVIALIGWRGIFLCFILFSVISIGWMGLRLPETLAPENRRPIQLPLLRQAIAEVFRNPTVRLAILAQALCLAILFTMLSMVQPVYDVIFDRADSFAYWFFVVALVSGTASILNAAIVVRIGMRRIVAWSLGIQIVVSGAMWVLATQTMAGDGFFYLFVGYQACVFFMAGTTMGNLNAIAMEPMGHIAGMAASIIGALSTVGGVAIAAPVGLMFDGTMRPLAAGITVFAMIGFLVMLEIGRIERRRII